MRGIRVGVAIAMVSSSCGGDDTIYDPQIPEMQKVAELAQTPDRSLDLLLVLDDSVGMVERQRSLAMGLPTLLDQLAAGLGGPLDLHVGVITTDMGTRAAESPTPAPPTGQPGQGGCSGSGKAGVLQTFNATLTGTDRFLRDVALAGGGREQNYTGTLAATLAALTSAGGAGCGFEQPLAAMRAALDGNPMNAGFVRPDAVLGVIFLGDEDDCSAKTTQLFSPSSPTLGPLSSFRCARFGVTCQEGGKTPDEMAEAGAKSTCGANPRSDLIAEIGQYSDFLRATKADHRRVVVAGIVGPPEPLAVELRPPGGGGSAAPALAHACTYTQVGGVSVADPAPRMSDFLDNFEERSARPSICEADLSGGTGEIADLLRRAMGSACVAGRLADVNPKLEGQQLDCFVYDDVSGATSTFGACADDPAARPCWRLEEDPALCKSGSRLKLVVERDAAPDPKTVTHMSCVLER
jgi:hypothetical protein